VSAVPGSNLLKKAFKIINKDSFIYRQFKSRTTNSIGIDIPVFEPDVDLNGSVQAVPRRLYQHHGLDWKKNYITIYSSDTIEGVNRDTSGDRVIFNGKLFQVLDENDWKPIDGWNGVICVEVSQ
jgi:hypothetical protein